MARVTKEQALAHRAAITTASSRLFREKGLGVSVADLMAEVGLTHGGFYGHFASKGALAASACDEAFAGALATWEKRIRDAGPDGARAALVESYVSTRSRNSKGTTCPTAVLAGDVSREPADAPVRAAYVAGTERLLDLLAATERSGDAAGDRSLAIGDLATMVGALVLARATAGTALSDEILVAARERLAEPTTALPPQKRVPSRGRA